MSLLSDKISDLQKRTAQALLGGGEKAVAKQIAMGKLPARERIRQLLDEGTFYEYDLFIQHEKVGEGGMAGSQINAGLTIEGGDVLVVNDRILLVGNGLRTSTQGIDMLISRFCKDKKGGEKYILVQELPGNVESFIHLDMTTGNTYPTTSSNRWKYNGKEIQTTGEVNWLDYGARMYDEAIGRWTRIDPLSEKYYGTSGYAYCVNNPIKYIDKHDKHSLLYRV